MPTVQIITQLCEDEAVLLEFQGKIETSAPQLNGLEFGELVTVSLY
jgi:hypothetical protein